MNVPEVRADAAAICTICTEELGYSCDAALVAEKLKALDERREAVYVAAADGKPVGFIHVEAYNLLYLETMANILGLAVKQAYRRKEIGRMLLQAAEKWAAANQIGVMRLNSGSSGTEAHDFYRHLGFDSEKKQIRFEKRLNRIK